MPRAVRLGFVYLSVLTLLLAGLGLFWTSRQVSEANARAQAQCAFNADLGPVPVTIPASGKPAILGVKIISDARIAWRRAGCPGRLAPPAPSFVRWARFYHLPAG
jgi:hypothetical protein